jgi:hypothetical protein
MCCMGFLHWSSWVGQLSSMRRPHIARFTDRFACHHASWVERKTTSRLSARRSDSDGKRCPYRDGDGRVTKMAFHGLWVCPLGNEQGG